MNQVIDLYDAIVFRTYSRNCRTDVHHVLVKEGREDKQASNSVNCQLKIKILNLDPNNIRTGTLSSLQEIFRLIWGIFIELHLQK